MDYDDRHNNEDAIYSQKKNDKISFEELTKRDKVLVNKIINDDTFAFDFFHEKCRPLISKIIWTIYGNNADYEELVNELYLLLKKPNVRGEYWHSLRTFDYRTTLFDWIKLVAVRHFYTPSTEIFNVPSTVLESGMAEKMFSELRRSDYRKFMWFKYIDRLDDEAIADKLRVERSQLQSLSRRAIRQLKSIIENSYPEYLNELFLNHDVTEIEIDESKEPSFVINGNECQDEKIDIHSYLDSMPNERYRYVVKALYLDDKAPEELAQEMGTPVSNIYNIKSRALDQLRDIVLYSNEISNLSKYINSIIDDRKRKILFSIFIEKKSYTEVYSDLKITEVEFKKLKKDAIKEIKNKIFKAKS